MFDPGGGDFLHLELTDQHGAEAPERGAPVAGEIRIGDRNHARVAMLQRLRRAGGGAANVIVRVGWNTLPLGTPEGSSFDLLAAEFVILAPSLPWRGYAAVQIPAACRLRWQIKPAFKRLKSLLRIDRLPTRTGRSPRSRRYAYLVLAVLATISAGVFWNLLPQDLADAAYTRPPKH